MVTQSPAQHEKFHDGLQFHQLLLPSLLLLPQRWECCNCWRSAPSGPSCIYKYPRSIYYLEDTAGSWESIFLYSFFYTRILKKLAKMTFLWFLRKPKHYDLCPNLGGWTKTWETWHITTSKKRRPYRAWRTLREHPAQVLLFLLSSLFLSNFKLRKLPQSPPCLQSYKWENPKNTMYQM